MEFGCVAIHRVFIDRARNFPELLCELTPHGGQQDQPVRPVPEVPTCRAAAHDGQRCGRSDKGTAIAYAAATTTTTTTYTTTAATPTAVTTPNLSRCNITAGGVPPRTSPHIDIRFVFAPHEAKISDQNFGFFAFGAGELNAHPPRLV